MTTLTRKSHNEQRHEFPVQLKCTRQEALRLGLYATAQKLDLAVKQVGWELAGDVTGMQRMERTKRKPRRKP